MDFEVIEFVLDEFHAGMKNVLFSVLEFEHIALIFESHHQKHILRAFNLQVVQGNQNTMRRYFHDLDMLTLL